MTERELAALLPLPLRSPLPADIQHIVTERFAAVLVPPGGPSRLFQKRRDLTEAALVRQRLLETLMTCGDVMPVAPGTRVDPAALTAVLALNAEVLMRAAAVVADAAQYQVTVEWREDQVLQQFRDTPELAPVFAGGTTSASTLARAVARLHDRLAREMRGRLDDAARDSVELPRRPGMLVNVALLAQSGDTLRIDGALEAIDAIWSEGLRLRLIGPGPAVSFGLLTLEWTSVAGLCDAAALLGLATWHQDNPPSRQAIDAARRRMLLAGGGISSGAVTRAAALLLAATGGTIDGALPLFVCRRDGIADTGTPAMGRVA